jgi:hypothetical protein
VQTEIAEVVKVFSFSYCQTWQFLVVSSCCPTCAHGTSFT